MIFFFAPETRFNRQVNHEEGSIDNQKSLGEMGIRETSFGHADESDSPPLSLSAESTKSWAQRLNPWSGISPHESYFALMFRPVPLLIYPACAFATLICQTTFKPAS